MKQSYVFEEESLARPAKGALKMHRDSDSEESVIKMMLGPRKGDVFDRGLFKCLGVSCSCRHCVNESSPSVRPPALDQQSIISQGPANRD